MTDCILCLCTGALFSLVCLPNASIKPHMYAEAYALCEKNGGLKQVTPYNIKKSDVVCVNGAEFKISSMGSEK